MKTFRTIFAVFQAILGFIMFCVIAFFFYNDLSSPYNMIIAAIIVGFGIYVSIFVFKMLKRRGIFSVMTADWSTYELDNLEPNEGDGVLKVSPNQLETLFSQDKLNFNNGTVSIWGDWTGRELDKKHQLKSVKFNSENDTLNLSFIDNCLLKIKNPKLIFITSTYLKIAKAKEVLWQTPHKPEGVDQYNYINLGKSIKTNSNTKWKPHPFDLGIGMDALYLQGNKV